MSIIVTPGPLEKRGEFYQQLGQLTAAGISLVNGLERLEQHPPSRADRAPLRQLLAQIQQGATFSEALRATGRWLPTFDIALLHAGEQSGRLPECFRLLSDHYRDRARLVRQVLADIAYPAIVLHLAIFIFPFPGLFLTGNLPVYLAKTVGVLAPLYLALLLVVIALQGPAAKCGGSRWNVCSTRFRSWAKPAARWRWRDCPPPSKPSSARG